MTAIATLPSSLSQLADMVFRIPGVEWGFLQQSEKLDERRVQRMPGAVGSWQTSNDRTTSYRVFLMYKGKGHESAADSPQAAIAEVLSKLGVSVRAKIVESESAAQALQSRLQSFRVLCEDDANQEREWKRTINEHQVTITTMQRLAEELAI
jgi:hypothetical protein